MAWESAELIVMRAPRDGYALLKTRRTRTTWLTALARPVEAWVIVAAALTIAATGHAAAASFLPTLAWWAVLPAVQILVAFAVIRGPGVPAVGLPRALDLLFVGHGPWSLWVIGFAVWAAFIQDTGASLLPFELLALLPIAWTSVILLAYCLEILQLDARAALRRVALHQALTWGLMLTAAATAVQFWPRVIEWFGRQ